MQDLHLTFSNMSTRLFTKTIVLYLFFNVILVLFFIQLGVLGGNFAGTMRFKLKGGGKCSMATLPQLL